MLRFRKDSDHHHICLPSVIVSYTLVLTYFSSCTTHSEAISIEAKDHRKPPDECFTASGRMYSPGTSLTAVVMESKWREV